MVSKKVIVKNRRGLDVKPARIVASTAETCKARVEIIYKYNIVNAKSFLNILSAAIVQGDEIELQCEGSDESQALEKLLEVFEGLE